MRWLVGLVALALAACDYVEETRDVGHKGKARVNPYLAAERLLEELDQEVVNEPGWPDFDEDFVMVLLPVSVLGAEGYVRDLEDWTNWGGHAVIFLERGETHLNDWGDSIFSMNWYEDEDAEPFKDWMDRAGIILDDGAAEDGSKKSSDKVTFEGVEYEVWMESRRTVGHEDATGPFVSIPYGEGRLTVIADARPFRNRYIGDYDHATLLARLADLSPYYGSVSFIRNASLSFWALVWQRSWAFLVALLALVGFWLWKNLPRFGPLDSIESGGTMRAYDHHLEALGDFHWRLDRGESLLRPLRDSLLERAHQLALSSGRPDADVFELIAERAGLPRDRAERAMTHERPRDAGGFTRLVADLQKLHLSLP